MEFQERWKRILLLFTEIKEIKICRQYPLNFSDPINAVELHCFSDASKLEKLHICTLPL